MVKINKSQAIFNTQQAQNTQNAQKATFQNSVWNTSINGEIEDTQQSPDTGDCWLLTDVNTLRDTRWGKKMIKDSIKKDGAGGAVITFKGAKGAEKEWHITADEIIKARESGKYSSGDDDMIAMELAMEKYLKKYGQHYDRPDNLGDKPGQILSGYGLDLAQFVELLSGKAPVTHASTGLPDTNMLAPIEEKKEELRKLFAEIEKHPGEYAVDVSFKYDWMGMAKDHAYQVKKIITEKGQKYAILVNPWDSSKTEKVPLEDLIVNLAVLRTVENPDAKPNPNLRTDLEKKIDYSDLIVKALQSLSKGKDVALTNYKELVKNTNADNIKELFGDKDMIEIVIKTLDKLKSGWGNGEEKKELIAPLVDSYCEYAKNKGVDTKIIEDVKKSCYKELDALFYTDEDVIIKKLQQLFDAIDDKENGWKKGLKINIDATKFGI